jgi:hypothetical protein
MEHSRFGREEIAQRGKAIYAGLREKVETKENIGKVILIDIETEEYAIDEIPGNPVEAALSLHRKHPDAVLWGERIGFDAVYALGGGSLLSTTNLLKGNDLLIEFDEGGNVRIKSRA